ICACTPLTLPPSLCRPRAWAKILTHSLLDSQPLVPRSEGKDKQSARGAQRTNAYRAYREPDKVLQGRRRKETWEVCLCNGFREIERRETIAYDAPRHHLSLSLFFSFHHIRIHWPFFLDGSQPSERKKKREIPESDPFHALKSFSAVTDNDS
ncbi:unnamed protein product, partial [Musa hybrid cultivar]